MRKAKSSVINSPIKAVVPPSVKPWRPAVPKIAPTMPLTIPLRMRPAPKAANQPRTTLTQLVPLSSPEVPRDELLAALLRGPCSLHPLRGKRSRLRYPDRHPSASRPWAPSPLGFRFAHHTRCPPSARRCYLPCPSFACSSLGGPAGPLLLLSYAGPSVWAKVRS